MGETTTLLEQYQKALALGQELLASLTGSVSEKESVARLQELLAKRRRLLEECGNLMETIGGGDENLLNTLQALIQQQRELETAWITAMQHIKQSSSQSRQARDVLQGVRRLLDTGPRSRLVDQRR